MSLKDAFASQFPLDVGLRSVDVTAVEETEEGVSVTVRLTDHDEDGEISGLMEQTFVLERPAPGLSDIPRPRPDRVPVPSDAIDPAALAANVRHHLMREGLRPMPFELFEPPTPHRPFAKPAEPDSYFGGLSGDLAEQACSQGFEFRYFVVDQWIEEARTLFYLGRLDAKAGGNGLEVFLHQNEGQEVMEVLGALERVGCERLARRYREALWLANGEDAEGVRGCNEDWLDENLIEPSGSAPTWKTIDHHDEDGTYRLLREELVPKAMAYVRAHESVLFTPGS